MQGFTAKKSKRKEAMFIRRKRVVGHRALLLSLAIVVVKTGRTFGGCPDETDFRLLNLIVVCHESRTNEQ